MFPPGICMMGYGAPSSSLQRPSRKRTSGIGPDASTREHSWFSFPLMPSDLKLQLQLLPCNKRLGFHGITDSRLQTDSKILVDA